MPYAGFAQDKHYLTEKFRHPVFPADSGVDNETLYQSICGFAESLGDLPYPVIKARCFEHVCRLIQIDTDPHDHFPAFGCWDRKDRPLTKMQFRFRDEVLSKGGTEHPMTLYKRFKGGEPTIDALLKRNGIKRETKKTR